MIYRMFGGANSPVQALSTFTFCYLAFQMLMILPILAYIGISELTKDKGDIVT